MTFIQTVIATAVALAAPILQSDTADGAEAHRRATIVPRFDHHQHLLGPTALPKRNPLLTAVEIPEDIAQLLARRAALFGNDASADEVAALYAEDAQIISWDDPTHWVSGRDAVLTVMRGAVTAPFHFVPTSFAEDDAVATVGGHVLVGNSPGVPALDFLIALKKTAAGWIIAADATMIKSSPRYPEPITAAKLIEEMNDAGVQGAIALSVAFWINANRYPDPADEMTREYEEVRKENDWVRGEVAKYPGRLWMACSANALRRYASAELERCSQFPESQAFKLHLADADIDLRKTDQRDKLKEIFRSAQRVRMPLIIHFGPRFDYDREYVDLFLKDVASLAPDVPIQIAHLGGDGPGITHPEGTAAWAAAIADDDPYAKNIVFDIAGLVTKSTSAEEAAKMVDNMRRIGLNRIVYGSDGQAPNAPVAQNWAKVRTKLPLSQDELRTLANNRFKKCARR